MAILNLLGAKAHLNASHAGAHYRCSPRTPFLARDGHFSEYATYQMEGTGTAKDTRFQQLERG